MRTKIWLSYQDENGQKIEGFFYKVAETDSYIKIETSNNVLTIPFHKINKVKEERYEKGGTK